MKQKLKLKNKIDPSLKNDLNTSQQSHGFMQEWKMLGICLTVQIIIS